MAASPCSPRDAARAVKLRRIGFIGFGEAGGILGTALARAGCEVGCYDILLDAPPATPLRQRLIARAAAGPVTVHDSLAALVRGSELVVSAVTATAAHDVTRLAADTLVAGQVYLDINSVSPETKRAEAALVAASGASYVEAAVMAPVPPLGLRVPMLLGGRDAAPVAAALMALGADARAVSSDIGVASAIKMCRSIFVKGLEALTVESLMTARRYGADGAVLASLHASYPGMGWEAKLPAYLISRVAEHGRRRAAEMREVAGTVQAAGFEPLMASAIARRQDALVDAMEAAGVAYPAGGDFDWRAFLAAVFDSTEKRYLPVRAKFRTFSSNMKQRASRRALARELHFAHLTHLERAAERLARDRTGVNEGDFRRRARRRLRVRHLHGELELVALDVAGDGLRAALALVGSADLLTGLRERERGIARALRRGDRERPLAGQVSVRGQRRQREG